MFWEWKSQETSNLGYQLFLASQRLYETFDFQATPFFNVLKTSMKPERYRVLEIDQKIYQRWIIWTVLWTKIQSAVPNMIRPGGVSVIRPNIDGSLSGILLISNNPNLQ